MARPRKLRDEDDDTLFECQCGHTQAAELTMCPRCGHRLCETCMPFGSMVACVDCADPDSSEFDDEIDF